MNARARRGRGCADFVKTLDKTARDGVAQQLQHQQEYDAQHGWEVEEDDDDSDADAGDDGDDDGNEEEEEDGERQQPDPEADPDEPVRGGASTDGEGPRTDEGPNARKDGGGELHSDDGPPLPGEAAPAEEPEAAAVDEQEQEEERGQEEGRGGDAVDMWGRMAMHAAARAQADDGAPEPPPAEGEETEAPGAEEDAVVVGGADGARVSEDRRQSDPGRDDGGDRNPGTAPGAQRAAADGGEGKLQEEEEEEDEDSSSFEAIDEDPHAMSFDGMAYGGDIGGFMFDSSGVGGGEDEDDDDDDDDDDEGGAFGSPARGASADGGRGLRGLGEGIGSAAKSLLGSMPPLLETADGAPGGGAGAAPEPTPARLREELDGYRAAVAKLEREKRALESAVAEADAKLEKSGRASAKWKRQKAASAARERELQSDAEASRTSVSFLEQRVRGLEGERAALKGEVAELQREIAESSRRQSETDGRRLMDLSEREAAAERRVQEERAAHNVTRDAALARESELLANLATTSDSLIQVSRENDARAERIGSLETQLEAAEREAAEAKEAATMEAARQRVMTGGGAQDGAPGGADVEAAAAGGADGGLGGAALREEANASRRQMQEAQVLRDTALAEVQRLRVELAGRDDDIAGRERARKEMEEKLNGMTDLLYEKQSQIDSTAHGDAAARRRMESDMRLLRDRLQDAEDELRRRRSPAGAGRGVGDDEMVSIEAGMGNAYGRLTKLKHAGPALKRSISVLDTTANTATTLMRRSPVVRVVFSVYFVLIHLMVYYLLHRLQHHVVHHHDGAGGIATVARAAADAAAAAATAGRLGERNATAAGHAAAGGVEYHDIMEGPDHLTATGAGRM